jgi:hypothetical protein
MSVPIIKFGDAAYASEELAATTAIAATHLITVTRTSFIGSSLSERRAAAYSSPGTTAWTKAPRSA